MAYEEDHKKKTGHRLCLDEREKLTLTGVEEVESFDEKQVVLRTTCGDLIIRGSELGIDKLSLDSGEVNVQGEITELCYEDHVSAGGFWSRLFG